MDPRQKFYRFPNIDSEVAKETELIWLIFRSIIPYQISSQEHNSQTSTRYIGSQKTSAAPL